MNKLMMLLIMVVVSVASVYAQPLLEGAVNQQIVMTSLAVRPLAFAENQGQWNHKVLFRAEANGATFFFCNDEVAYLFVRDTDELLDDAASSVGARHGMPDGIVSKFDKPLYKKEAMLIKAQFVGANPNPEIIVGDRLPYNCNYFYGNEPAKWRTDVPNYSAITYKDVWPGVDMYYHGNGRGMKYDFTVNPGADISQIRIRYEGVDELSISNSGDLQAQTRFGLVYENIPEIYQISNGIKSPVAGSYRLFEPEIFGFEVEGYNPSLPLVIDPELVYSTYLGGNDYDYGYGIAVDGGGNAYVTGWTQSTDFPTLDPYQTDQGDEDVFVTKLSSGGNSLVYNTYLGGNGIDEGYGIAADGSGCAYVAGRTYSTDFPTLDPYQTGQGERDAFVTKLSSDGNSLVYSTYLGGNDYDTGYGIAVDAGGNAYVTGWTQSTDFPTLDPYQTGQGERDVFVTKLSLGGNSLVYSTYLGGNDLDYGYGIAVDVGGNAYVTGFTSSTDFPTENPYQTDQGNEDAFVTKLSSGGNSLVYSTYLGGNYYDAGDGIAVDAGGNAYVTGYTLSTEFPTENPYQTGQNGYDAFVTKLSSDGNSLVYSTYLGGNDFDLGYGIAVDVGGNAYVTGFTSSTDFPTENPYQTDQGNMDAFVTMLVPEVEPSGYNYLAGDANMSNETVDVGNPLTGPWRVGGDVTFLVNYFDITSGNQPCLIYNPSNTDDFPGGPVNGYYFASADATGEGLVTGGDVSRLVAYFGGTAEIKWYGWDKPDPENYYPPMWLNNRASGLDQPVPELQDLVPGWPNCQEPPEAARVMPSETSNK